VIRGIAGKSRVSSYRAQPATPSLADSLRGVGAPSNEEAPPVDCSLHDVKQRDLWGPLALRAITSRGYLFSADLVRLNRLRAN